MQPAQKLSFLVPTIENTARPLSEQQRSQFNECHTIHFQCLDEDISPQCFHTELCQWQQC